MAASGDVTIAQNGGQGNVKLHPYFVALVRWCVSCVWSSATILFHRIIAGYPIPSIAAPRPLQKTRAASKDHLHPEPRVECQVLYTPSRHHVDVIFVHGLYGSLGNTWRQGDWKPKYSVEPNRVPLLRPSTCDCRTQTSDNPPAYGKLDEQSHKEIEEKFYKRITDDEAFITEHFYNNTLLDQVEIVDNYETQAQFVRELFDKENYNGCDAKCNLNVNEVCECRINEVRQCEVGCGCVCDQCYSACWPRDWIKEDYPDARVISINYTSDPYLWRPLWVKECKRLRLHERADQMTQQLLDLGVGERPIIWVGHSKGGLFIKQIFCDAYEAHMKTRHRYIKTNETKHKDENNKPTSDIENNNVTHYHEFANEVGHEINEVADNRVEVPDNTNDVNESLMDTMCIENETAAVVTMGERGTTELTNVTSSNSEEDTAYLVRRANLWRRSSGFMFYSVPHRGSPLAAIKTPITARSIELLEISKDCSLVLSLQHRWLQATQTSSVQVRSLVETCKTLMSVLWLRIVSVTSADAGIGSLYGVSVDHREICKPSSRRCLLYRELMTLMHSALHRCSCN